MSSGRGRRLPFVRARREVRVFITDIIVGDDSKDEEEDGGNEEGAVGKEPMANTDPTCADNSVKNIANILREKYFAKLVGT